MLDLLFNFNVLTTPVLIANSSHAISCNVITIVPKVCKKRKVSVQGKATKYYLTLTNGSGEFEVNRCTYLASLLYGYYVIEEDNKWCSNER